jgi:hypothetical protein
MRPLDPVWEDLPHARALSGDEHRLLAALVAAVDEPLLHRQVATAVVIGVCRCGCSSVRLSSEEPALPPARVAELSYRSDPLVLSVEASSSGPAGERVQVVLHVIRGRLEELEVFVGEGVAVLLADVPDPTDVSVS